MSDEPGFGPETHSTYEPTPEEVAARPRGEIHVIDGDGNHAPVPVTVPSRQADEALDRRIEVLLSVPFEPDTRWEDEARQVLATVRDELERLREERDATHRTAAVECGRAEAAEAEVRELTAVLNKQHALVRRLTEGLRVLADWDATKSARFGFVGMREYAAQVLAASSPPPGDTEGGPGVSTFRKKPVEIEAVRWDGSKQAMDEIHALGGWGHVAPNPPADDLIIDTLEGEMRAQIGDWIVRGVQGEFYPCKPDIFEATYEAVPPVSGEGQPDGGGEA